MPQASFKHIPKVRLGYQCPQPSVLLPIPTLSGEFSIRFVLDTAAAITLIPKPLAEQTGIEYDESELPEKFCPKTMNGRLRGCHRGDLRTTFLTRQLIIPFVVYTPKAPAKPPPAKGPPGAKKRARNITDEPIYFQEVERNESNNDDEEAPAVLGRVGFLNRFHVLIGPYQTTVSTEPIIPPDRRGWFGLHRLWRRKG